MVRRPACLKRYNMIYITLVLLAVSVEAIDDIPTKLRSVILPPEAYDGDYIGSCPQEATMMSIRCML